MPIVYIHGVAVRDNASNPIKSNGNALLERLLEDIDWEMVEGYLRRIVAPAMSTDPDAVALVHGYWGDLAAKLAWDGASCMPDWSHEESLGSSSLSRRSLIISEMRQPLNRLGALFFGDVFCYLNERGNFEKPGSIVQRVLDKLTEAQAAKNSPDEPLIVLTNSMGGQIMYDIVTHFLPKMPEFSDMRIDYWCSVASQVGLFEEMKLFLCSSDAYGKNKNNKVPFPDRKHLGIWWNVWDVDDIISYSVLDIIEGVDDMPFRVGQSLLREHIGYLQSEVFYKLFADRLRKAFPRKT